VIWWAVALGGLLGAPSRYLVGVAVRARWGPELPWGTLAVNLLGSGAAGLLAGLGPDDLGPTAAALVAVGFLGAFTTASTFAVEVADLDGARRRRDAVLVVVSSVVLGTGLALGAFQVGRAL
jgi:CrcB protein